jgi:hypothetical protein
MKRKSPACPSEVEPDRPTTFEGPLDSFQRAERLFKDTQRLGCDTPTEAMIADAIQDAEFDTLHNYREIAKRHDQFKSTSMLGQIRQMYFAASKVQQHQIRHWFREAEMHAKGHPSENVTGSDGGSE